MFTDEENVHEMWCPLARIFDPVKKAVGYNAVQQWEDGQPADTLHEEIANCRGSRCMMWRFKNDTHENLDGYCGLAGRPIF